jgi:hypothetical protein
MRAREMLARPSFFRRRATTPMMPSPNFDFRPDARRAEAAARKHVETGLVRVGQQQHGVPEPEAVVEHFQDGVEFFLQGAGRLSTSDSCWIWHSCAAHSQFPREGLQCRGCSIRH